jgi:hypothetical protein
VATITFLTITICRGTCIDVVQTKTYTITAIFSILQTAMTSAAGDCISTIRSSKELLRFTCQPEVRVPKWQLLQLLPILVPFK